MFGKAAGANSAGGIAEQGGLCYNSRRAAIETQGWPAADQHLSAVRGWGMIAGRDSGQREIGLQPAVCAAGAFDLNRLTNGREVNRLATL